MVDHLKLIDYEAVVSNILVSVYALAKGNNDIWAHATALYIAHVQLLVKNAAHYILLKEQFNNLN